MSATFITGDRSASPVYLPLVAVELLAAVNRGDDIVTGDNAGVEQLVRTFAELSGVQVNVIDTPMTSEGFSDWTARDQFAKNFVDNVRVLHADAHSSRVTKSVLDVFGDDAVELVSPQTLGL